MNRPAIAAALCLSVSVLVSASFASNWPHDPGESLLIGGQTGAEGYVEIAPDGFGGAVVAWVVNSGYAWARRVDGWGTPLWPAPVLVCGQPGARFMRGVIADGEGGAIIVWDDGREGDPGQGDVYAQRVGAEGTPMWTTDGVRVCVNDSIQSDAAIVGDGAGGACVVWTDLRYGSADTDIMAQHLDDAGNRMWDAGGVTVCNAVGMQGISYIILTADGMPAVAWSDMRVDVQSDVYCQKLDWNGQTMWALNGVAAASQNGVQEAAPRLAADNYGGVYCVWHDWRGAPNGVYGQRIDAYGNTLWTLNGERLTTMAYGAGFPGIVADGTGGAIICFWTDPGGGNSVDLGVQRIDPNGVRLWGDDVAVVTAPGSQSTWTVESDGAGGAVLAWQDNRYGDTDIYAQRVDAAGNTVWTSNGVAVSTALQLQIEPVFCGDGAGGLIVAWEDYRGDGDIYGQRVERHGYLGYPSPDIGEVADSPMDQGGYVTVVWERSYLDAYPYDEVEDYTVWRWAAPVGPEVTARAADATSDARDRALAAGLDGAFVERQAALGWEYVGTTPAAQQVVYAHAVPTFADSTGDGAPEVMVKVIAHGASASRVWESLPAAGYSKDNLAPAPPFGLVAQRVGNYVRLEWTPNDDVPADFSHYAVYRASDSGVQPDPMAFLDGSTVAEFWDHIASPDSPWFYVVTAVDVHENNSEPTNEAMVNSTTTGIGDRPPTVTRLTVLDNIPNPFDTSTELRVGLPRDAEVTMDVYDVAGRRMLTRRTTLTKGWQRVMLDGRSLPSGVYFCRVHAAGETVTRKLVIQR